MPSLAQRLRHSIQLELALLSALVIGGCGLVLGLGTYTWLSHKLVAEAETFAKHEADEISNVAAAAGTEAELLERQVLLSGMFPEPGVLALEVWSLDGRLVLGLPREGSPLFGPWPEGLAGARAGRRPLGVLTAAGRPALRTARRIDYAHEPRWVVVSVIENHQPAAVLARFAVTYGLALGLAVVLSFGGSLLLVKRALRPVQALVNDASLIAMEGPERRLAVPGPGSELRELALLLNGMLARITANVDQLRRFTAHAGHELRTPLTRIRGEAELALGEDDVAAQRERLASILEETEALSRVVDGLLEQAHGEPLDLSRERPFALGGLVSELAEQAQAVAAGQVTVEVECDASLVVRASRPLLSRAIWNLLDNAVKFGQRPGRIRVRGRAHEDWIELEVADDGPGFGAQDPESLFDAFNTGDAPPELRGHGLGLALSRTIARRHGGELTARQSGILGGACFLLRLPCLSRTERATAPTGAVSRS